MDRHLPSLTDRLKAVANPLRLRVLALVGAGELCVCQVAETLQVPLSSVSEALRELRRAGFIAERKAGRWVHVSVPAEGLSPLQRALVVEAMATPEAAEDRRRAEAVNARPVQEVCCKARSTEGTHA